jgi:hypothetical protein
MAFMRRRHWLALAALPLFAAPAHATTGAQIVSYLNAQRAANGIPAGITEDPVLSEGCAKHNRYDAMNKILTHVEEPDKPGYTPEGAQAGKTSVLYVVADPEDAWTAGDNPFETAPIHLHQLLSPRLFVMGAAETDGWGCATTQVGLTRPPPAAQVTYTYPGDGAKNVPIQEFAHEVPFTPGSRVGIPDGTATGPYLYMMFDGPAQSPFDDARVVSAGLTGPGGPVDIVPVDNLTDGAGALLPPGAEIIPRRPLAPRTTYTASISAIVSARPPPRYQPVDIPFTHTWRFTTGVAEQAPPSLVGSKVRLARSSAGRSSKGVIVVVRCTTSCVLDARGTVKIPGARAIPVTGTGRHTGAGKVSVTLKLSRANRARVRRAGRTARVRVTVKAINGGSLRVDVPVR